MLGYEGVDLLKFNYSSLAAAKRASKGVWAGARADGVSFSVDHVRGRSGGGLSDLSRTPTTVS